MARIETDPNYTAPTFSRATAPTDIFKKEDVQNLAAALSIHDHTSGKGVPIGTGAIGVGAITSAMLADGTIATADIADAAITTAKLALGAASVVNFASDSSAQSTTGGPTAIPGNTAGLTLTIGAGDVVVALGVASLLESSVGAIGLLAVGQDATYQGITRIYHTVASQPVSHVGAMVYQPSVGAHTYSLGWLTSGGTLSTDTNLPRYLILIQIKR